MQNKDDQHLYCEYERNWDRDRQHADEDEG